MNEKTIAIIGAGNGGFAMAADLALSGWKINLYELPRFSENITPLLDKGGIDITGAANTGFAKLANITSDIKEAVKDAPIIMIATQALTHKEVATILAPNISDGQTIFILPGNGGSLIFAKIFQEKRTKIKIDIAEVLTLPYGCRKTSLTSVNISRMLGNNFVANLPSKNNSKILTKFKEFYPDTFLMNNVLEVAISNPNIIVHPAGAMLNMSRIEFVKGDFGLYQEGFSPSVMKVIDGIDYELLNIRKVLNLPIISFKELFEKRYKKSFEEQFFGIMRKLGSRGPFDVKTRYITEDVPIGMVLVASIGKWLGVETPTFDAIIHLCGLMTESDYWKEGRTLESLGLFTMSIEGLKKFLEEGT